jgi:hypothetical protein
MKKILFALFLVFPIISFAQSIDLDKDGVVDDYDVFLQNKINDGSISKDIKYPIRNFTLDTLNKDVEQSVNPDGSTDTDSILYEYSSKGKEINKWKTKFEKKGHARASCQPPMINITFDKTDSKGKPKELFGGISTYPGYKSLQYQKVRFVSNCDIYDFVGFIDQYNHYGFNKTVDIQLMDYSFYKILRLFGIPSVDPVAFANLKIKTSTKGYEGNTYNYIVLQRDNELDDQIPFTKQFNLDQNLIQDGKTDKWVGIFSQKNALDNLSYRDVKNNKDVNMDMDIDSQIKYKIFTYLLQIGDRGILHNEDYGMDLTTKKWKAIPYGFDMSMGGCYFNSPSRVDEVILSSLNTDNTNIKKHYYNIAREIFSDVNNLYKMELVVDQFPFDVDKTNMKRYLKMVFNEYRNYYLSKDFANFLGQNFTPIDIKPIYTSNSQRDVEMNKFYSSCDIPLKDKSISVEIIENPKITLYKSTNANWNLQEIQGNFKISLTALEDINIPKSGFVVVKVYFDSKNIDERRKVVSVGAITDIDKSVEPVAGPYYFLKKGKTIEINSTFTVGANYYDPGSQKELPINGNVYASIDSMNFGYGFNSYKVKENKSNILSLVNSTVATPGSDDSRGKIIDNSTSLIKDVQLSDREISKFKNYDITWSSRNSGNVSIELYDIRNRTLVKTITSSNTVVENPGKISNHTFRWAVPYNIDNDIYKIRVSNNDNKRINSVSDKFEISDFKDKTVGVAEVVDIANSTSKIVYDGNNNEKNIRLDFKVKIKAYEDIVVKDLYVIATRLVPDLVPGMSKNYYGYGPIKGENNSGFVMKKGEEKIIDVYAEVTTSMYRGQYNFSFSGMGAYDSRNNYSNVIKKTNQEIGKPLVIVGEVSPYILSIVQEKNKLIINGINFKIGKNVVSINGVLKNIETKDPNKMEIDLAIFDNPVGQDIPIYIETEKGRSNQFLFNTVKLASENRKTIASFLGIDNTDMEILNSSIIKSFKLIFGI